LRLELLGPGEAAAHIAPAIVRKWYLSLSSIAVNSDLRIHPGEAEPKLCFARICNPEAKNSSPRFRPGSIFASDCRLFAPTDP
jgi:hypothetical protein